MPGLDLSQVSGNWKKLQENLRTEKKPDTQQQSGKRKRLDVASKNGNGVKKAKLSHSTQSQRRDKTFMDANEVKNGEHSTPKHDRHALAQQLGVSQEDISAAYGATNGTPVKYNDEVNGGLHPTHKIGKYVAMDCEMVGTGPPPHEDNVLARVSLVNFNGEQIYDSYVQAPRGVIVEDYRTFVSGIKREHLLEGFARPLPEVQKDVADIMEGRILVGHALWNDLQVLLLSHPKRDLRDTSRHPKFRVESRGRPPALRNLAKSELGMQIQAGEHSSIEDARTAMMLFKKEKAGFEEENRKKFGTRVNAVSRAVQRSGKANGKAAVKGSIRDGNEDETDDDEDLGFLDGEETDNDLEEEPTNDQPLKVVAVKKRNKKKKRTKRK